MSSEKIVVPSISFYEQSISLLTSSIDKRKNAIKQLIESVVIDKGLYKRARLQYQKEALHNYIRDDGYKIKQLAEKQRIEKKLLAYIIRHKTEMECSMKAVEEFVNESISKCSL